MESGRGKDLQVRRKGAAGQGRASGKEAVRREGEVEHFGRKGGSERGRPRQVV